MYIVQYTYEIYVVPENKVPGQEDEVTDSEGFQVAKNSHIGNFYQYFLRLIEFNCLFCCKDTLIIVALFLSSITFTISYGP